MTIRKFTALLKQGSVDVGCIQDQGGRDYQEDTVGFSELPEGKPAERFSAIVADGMGGMSSGAFVSDYAVKSLLAAEPDSPAEILSAVSRISGEIAAGGSHGGTTLAAVYILPEGVYFCSVGDSRIYLLRDGEFTQLTADQDYMSMLLDRVIDGKIDWQQAKSDPERNALAQFVGSGVQLYPDMNCIPLRTQPGDRLLICSDGVYNALSREDLRQSLTLTAGGAAEDILGRVLARGYANQDNFTAVVLQFMPGWSDSQQPDGGIPEEGCHIDSAFRAVGCESLRATQYIHNGVFTCGGDNVSAYYFRLGVLLHPGADQGGRVEIQPGDAFLLCTEGFRRCVSEGEITADLIKSQSAAEWLRAMLKRHILASGDGGEYSAVCGIVKSGPGEQPREKSPRRIPLGLLIAAAAAVAGIAAVLIWLISGGRL